MTDTDSKTSLQRVTGKDTANGAALTIATQNAPDWDGIGAQIVEQFARASTKTALTVTQYTRCTKAFFHFLTANGAARVDGETVRRYQATLEGEGKKAATIRAYMQAPAFVIEWTRKRARALTETFGGDAVRQFATLFDPLAFEDKPRIEGQAGHKRGALTGAQMDAVLRHFETIDGEGVQAETHRRNHAIGHLMAAIGCRCVEISRLKVGQVTVEGDRLAIGITHKGHTEPETVYLPAEFEASRALLTVIDDRTRRGAGANDFVFVSTRGTTPGAQLTPRAVYTIIRGALEAAGVKCETITPHSLRHTFATLALESVTDAERPAMLREVQRLYGHTSTQITERYTHDIDAKKATAQRAVEAARQQRAVEAEKPKRGRPKGSKDSKKRAKTRKRVTAKR